VALKFPSITASNLQLDGRGCLRSNKVDTELSLKILCEFTDDGMSPITRGNWQFTRNLRTIEKAYYKADTAAFVIIYRIMISN
jgi:hypothetical protein